MFNGSKVIQLFSRQCLALATAFIGLLLSTVLHAHTIRPAIVSVVTGDDDIAYVEIKANVEVWVAGVSPDYADTNDSPQAEIYDALRAGTPEDLTEEFDAFAPEFISALQLRIDNQPVDLVYEGIRVEPEPDLELTRDSFISLTAQLPAEAETLQLIWPDQFGSHVIRISREGSENIYSTWLKRGQIIDPYPIGGEFVERSGWEVGLDYLIIGFEHIVPKGLDHILFVIGIFLLSTKFAPLLWQVTAFTLAHTITLGLSIYGVISAPPSIVEPLIALSIAYVGIENILSSKLQPWRIVLVFLFGLLHGMGFAGVLSEIGLPREDFLTALITFNVGVELGQLAVILLCFLIFGWWRNHEKYRQYVVIPGSLFIAVIGLYWTWERVFG